MAILLFCQKTTLLACDDIAKEAKVSGTVFQQLEGNQKALPDAVVAIWQSADAAQVKKIDPYVLKLQKPGFAKKHVAIQVNQPLVIDIEYKNNYAFEIHGAHYETRNFIIRGDEEKYELTFNKSNGIVYLKSNSCDAKCVITICPSPMFAITDKQGKYSLNAILKEGEYDVYIIHPELGVNKQRITIVSREMKDVDFVLRKTRPRDDRMP
ncbi:MAG: hypothetical protein U0798_03625 [Gemmataceae bacterium]